MVDYNILTSEIDESNAFILPNGLKIRSLSSLIDALKTMEPHFFSEHVNLEKNDFANWIEHCFKDELLAQRIRKLNTKEEIALEISTRIEQSKLSQSLKSNDNNSNKNDNSNSINPEKIETITPISKDTNIIPDIELDADLGLEEPKTNETQKIETKLTNLEPVLTQSLESSLEPTLEPSLEPSLDSSLSPEVGLDSDLGLDASLNLDNKIDNIILKPDIKPDIKEMAKSLDSVMSGVDISTIKKTEFTPQENISNKAEKVVVDAEKILSEKVVLPVFEPKLEIKTENTIETAKPNSVETLKVEFSEEEKQILNTDNNLLSASQLFKKLRLQKLMPKSALTQNKVEEAVIVSKSETPKEINLAGLNDDEKTLISTANSKLSFKDLFKKLKLQRERGIKDDKQSEKEKAKVEDKLGAVAKINSKEAPPVDLLGLSEEDFNKLIGINLTESYIATLSKEHIVTIKQRKNLKTGVPGFDELLDKGIPEGSAILVSGGPGSGKTTFCIQQLGFGAEHGEKCLFISLEEEEDRLVDHMKGYGLNPDKYLRNGLLKVKKLDSFKLARSVEALLAHARGELMIDIEPVLDIIPDGFKPDRVVIDSLSSIAAAFAGRPEEYRIYVEQLFNIFGRVGATSFIITEIQGSESTGHGGVEDFLADGVINFYNMRKGNIRQPAVEILKMRGTRHKKKIVPFNFISGKGIEIYPLEEVFHEL